MDIDSLVTKQIDSSQLKFLRVAALDYLLGSNGACRYQTILSAMIQRRDYVLSVMLR
jgi:hypothetical protein